MVKLYQNIHIRILRPITQHVKLTLIFGLGEGPTSTSHLYQTVPSKYVGDISAGHESMRRLGCD